MVFYSCDPGRVPVGRMMANCTRSGWSPNPGDAICTSTLWCLSGPVFLYSLVTCCAIIVGYVILWLAETKITTIRAMSAIFGNFSTGNFIL